MPICAGFAFYCPATISTKGKGSVAVRQKDHDPQAIFRIKGWLRGCDCLQDPFGDDLLDGTFTFRKGGHTGRVNSVEGFGCSATRGTLNDGSNRSLCDALCWSSSPATALLRAVAGVVAKMEARIHSVVHY